MMKFLLCVITLTVVSARLSADTFTELVAYKKAVATISTQLIIDTVSYGQGIKKDFDAQCPDKTINCTAASNQTQDNCCREDDGDWEFTCEECIGNLDSDTTTTNYIGPVLCAQNDDFSSIMKNGLLCAKSGALIEELNHKKTNETTDIEKTTSFNRTELYDAMKFYNEGKTSFVIDAPIPNPVYEYLLHNFHLFRRPLVQAGDPSASINASFEIQSSAGEAGHLFEPTNHGKLLVTGGGEAIILGPINTGPIDIHGNVSVAVFGGSNTGPITSNTTGYLVVADLTNSGDIVVGDSNKIWLKNLINSGDINVTDVEADVQNVQNTGTVNVKGTSSFWATGIDNSGGTIIIGTDVSTCIITFITGKEGVLTDPSNHCSKTFAVAPLDFAPGNINGNYGGGNTPPSTYNAAGTTVPTLISGLVLAAFVSL